MFSYFSCHSQDGGDSKGLINRRAVFAGQFYPAQPDTLRNELKKLFEKACPKQHDNVIAIISPHAGYVYSGKAAGSAFNQIDKTKKYEHIFVITSSHRVAFEGASIYYIGNYLTPLGTVKVDTELSKTLVDAYSFFTYRHDAHAQEHSLEVQLPFLQYILENDFKIVPIVIGSQSVNTVGKIADALYPYFNSNNLFVISSDFSHYPTQKEALNIDKLTVDAILSNNSETLITQLSMNDKMHINGLATSLCGWSSVLTLLKMSEKHRNITVHLVEQSNSGDSEYGDKDRVVGYAAIAFKTDDKGIVIDSITDKKAQKDEFDLSPQEKDILLHLVKNTLKNYIPDRKKDVLNSKDFPESLHAPLGVFVSLYKNNMLRGCIGRFYTDAPLYETVQEMSIASATQDTRFNPVTKDELKDLQIEISVLSPMKRIYSADEIVLGKHGIYIKKGGRSGTFLPQVATETGWSLDEFLGHCSRDKAGLGWDGWKTAELYIYTALVFGEK